MSLGFSEVRRAKLRFGLLTAAVSLLVFLVLLLTTLAGALVGSLTGALDGLQAQGLVYSAAARDNIAASRLDPATTDAVAAVPGVAAVGAVGTFTTRAVLAGSAEDAQVFGFEPEAPGAPGGLTDGRLPSAEGEAAVDGGGVEIGDTVTLEPTGIELHGRRPAAGGPVQRRPDRLCRPVHLRRGPHRGQPGPPVRPGQRGRLRRRRLG